MNVHKNATLTPAGREVLVRRIEDEGWSGAEVAAALGVSKRTVWKWVVRYRQEGVGGLADRSSRPHRSPTRLSNGTVVRIVVLRRKRRTGRQIAKQLKLAVSTVSLWLRRVGLERLKKLEPSEPVVRYERKRPGELVHLDIKPLGRIDGIGHRIHGNRRRRSRGVGWEYLHVCIDDATRLAYVEVLSDQRAETTCGFLRRAAAWFAKKGVGIERAMTDNGSAYVSKAFAGALARLGARHLRTRPYRPQTNGKAERFIQTALNEWAYARPYRSSYIRTQALRRFQRWYNQQRDHSSIGDQPPLSRLAELR